MTVNKRSDLIRQFTLRKATITLIFVLFLNSMVVSAETLIEKPIEGQAGGQISFYLQIWTTGGQFGAGESGDYFVGSGGSFISYVDNEHTPAGTIIKAYYAINQPIYVQYRFINGYSTVNLNAQWRYNPTDTWKTFDGYPKNYVGQWQNTIYSWWYSTGLNYPYEVMFTVIEGSSTAKCTVISDKFNTPTINTQRDANNLYKVHVASSVTSGTFVSVQSYEWDWGDGSKTTTTTPTAEHTYNAIGTYTITLKLTGQKYITTTTSIAYTINPITIPPEPVYPDIMSILSKIWEWLRSILGIMTITGLNQTNVSQTYNYDLKLTTTPIDTNWQDGYYEVLWANWALIDNQTVISQGNWTKLTTSEYRETAIVTMSNKPSTNYLVGFIVKQSYRYDVTKMQWTLESETIVQKEVFSITVNAPLPPEPMIPWFLKILYGILDWLKELFGLK